MSLDSVKEKLLAVWARLNQPLKDLWVKDKWFLLLFGVVILVVKFRGLLIDLIVASSKKLVVDTKTKDDELQKQEQSANSAAELLIQRASSQGQNSPPISDDWNEK